MTSTAGVPRPVRPEAEQHDAQQDAQHDTQATVPVPTVHPVSGPPGPTPPGPTPPGPTPPTPPGTPWAAARSQAWPVPLLAVVAWLLGLLPWLMTRSSTGTFGTPWNPRNDLREALLPFHHAQLMLLLTVTVIAGGLSGLAPLWVRHRRGRRWQLALLTVLGAALATAGAVAQTLAPDPDLGGRGLAADTVQLAFVALTVAGSLLGLALGLCASLGGPVLRTVAATPLVVVGADWLGIGAIALLADPSGSRGADWLGPVLVALTGLVVGVLLAALGVRPLWRLVGWVLAVGLLLLVPALLTGGRYVLEALRGTPPNASELAELLGDGFEVVGRSAVSSAQAFGPATPSTAVLVALLVGALGAVLLSRVRRPADATAPAPTP